MMNMVIVQNGVPFFIGHRAIMFLKTTSLNIIPIICPSLIIDGKYLEGVFIVLCQLLVLHEIGKSLFVISHFLVMQSHASNLQIVSSHIHFTYLYLLVEQWRGILLDGRGNGGK